MFGKMVIPALLLSVCLNCGAAPAEQAAAATESRAAPATPTLTPAPSYREGAVPLPDGGQTAYYIRKGDGPNLVLIPGSWGDYRVFDALVDHLSTGLNLIIIEMRGHGGSQPPTLSASIEMFADDVLRVVDALGLRRFYVGGHSIGGMIPIEVAARRPEAVAGAIALEGWTHYLVASEAFGDIETRPLRPEQDRLRLEQRARVLDHLTEDQQQSFAAAWRKWDGLPILERTALPILEIWGDRGAPARSRGVMRIPDRPNIKLVWIHNVSHTMLIEDPTAVAKAVNEFIAEHEK